MQVQCLGQEDPLGEGMATHSNILAWKIPWTEDPGELWLKEKEKNVHVCVTESLCCAAEIGRTL